MKYFLLIATLFVFSSTIMMSQNGRVVASADTLKTDSLKPHSPVKASLFSAVLPGLGQAYNKKYWKIPIIYAGLATTVYLAVDYNSQFQLFKQAYINRTDNDPNTIDPYLQVYNDQTMVQIVDYYKRNRDFMIILSGVIYALNIIDASVDAHLFYFDVSDDLSLRITPTMQRTAFYGSYTKGFSLTLNF